MIKLGKFQTQQFTGWKSETLKNHHLAGMFQRKPQEATNLMVQLMALRYGKTLNTFLSQYPTKLFDSDDEYTWNVIGSSRRNYPLVEARDMNGTVIDSTYPTNVGVNGEPFYLVFAEDWIFDGELVVGELNEVYPIRVLGQGQNEGSNVKYRVQLWGSVRGGMPKEQLLPTKRFSVDFAPVEGELSRKVGGVRFATPVAMRNEFSHLRIHQKVSGAQLDKKLAIGLPVEDEKTGKVVIQNKWMPYVQWQVEKQWDDYKNHSLAFSRSNRNMNGEYLDKGKSGEVIRYGDGLFAQMEAGNTESYNRFSLKQLVDILYQICNTSLDFNQRKFIIKTGQMGAIQFSKAALAEGSGWSPITYEYDANALGVMAKTSSKMTPHGGAYKMTVPQVTEFVAPNGVYVKIDTDPLYDDPVRNKIQHYLGGPVMSYRYDIFDMGTMDQPNIFKVGVRGQEGDFTSYYWGLTA